MRQIYVAGNWKMTQNRASTAAFCPGLVELAARHPGVRIGLFPGYLQLRQVVEALDGSGVVVGAQTCHPAEKGAHTGDVSALQIADAGARAVIVGHSERRHGHAQGDAEVRARLDAGLAAGLDVILCLGETGDERAAGATTEVVTRQLEAGLTGLDGETLAARVTLAYEPVWAIGTGLNATPAQAQEVHALLRERVADLAGADAAQRLIIQYGGSVNPDNAGELLACPDVDGALVGGASCRVDSFAGIVRQGEREVAS